MPAAPGSALARALRSCVLAALAWKLLGLTAQESLPGETSLPLLPAAAAA